MKDSGGAGFHRGGNGVEKRYVYLEPGHVSIHDDRWLTRPWGVLGGQPGERSTKILRRADGSEEVLPAKCDEVAVEPGDMLIYRTAGGGGWKDRLDRPVEAVERDVAYGLVSAEKALSAYGVVIGDAAATEAERDAPEGGRAATRPRSTSARRWTRCSRAARTRRAFRRRCRRSRCAGRRWRVPASPRWSAPAVAERRAGSSFGGAAGFGERPAVVVVDLNLGFTDPSSPLACDLDDVLLRTSTLLGVARRMNVPVFFTTVVYDAVGEAAAAVFLRKVPALKSVPPGHAVGRDRPAPGPPGVRADPRQGARLRVLRHAVRRHARGPRHADRLRRLDLRLRPRDRRRRHAARPLADRATRVRRRSLISCS